MFLIFLSLSFFSSSFSPLAGKKKTGLADQRMQAGRGEAGKNRLKSAQRKAVLTKEGRRRKIKVPDDDEDVEGEKGGKTMMMRGMKDAADHLS